MAKFEAKRAVDMTDLHEFNFIKKDDKFEIGLNKDSGMTEVFFYPESGKEYIEGHGKGLDNIVGQLVGTLDSVTAYDKKKQYTISGFDMDASKFLDQVNKNGIEKLLEKKIMKGSDTVNGSKDKDKLLGYSGNDTIDGRGDKDKLTGGSGDDAFRFTVDLGGDNLGKIQDFGKGNDSFELSQAVFGALGATGKINPDFFFVVGSGPAGPNDFLIYDQSSGELFYDADGDGSDGVLFATVKAGTTLDANDFFVV